MALGNITCSVGDQSGELPFDLSMDINETSHGSQTGAAAREPLGGFTLFTLALCCDIADVLIVGFLSEPDGMSAFIDVISWNNRNLTFSRYDQRGDHSLSENCRNLNCLRFRRLLVRAWHGNCQWIVDCPSRAW